jgi:predicted phage replisome organizer
MMGRVSWIKITTDIFDDEKIKIIDSMPDHDAILVIWIKLLTLAGKCNSRGCLLISDSLPYTNEMLAAVFSRPLNTIKMALGVFEQLGMICRSDAIQLVNWEKYQNEAALEVIRENERERKRIQRAKQTIQITDSNNVPDNVPDKSRNIRTLDIDIDKEEDIRKRSKNNNFIRPTRNEVKEYCNERSNNIDVEQFIDYYTSKGWMIGKNKMKDWKAAVRNWERYDKNQKSEIGKYTPPKDTPVAKEVDPVEYRENMGCVYKNRMIRACEEIGADPMEIIQDDEVYERYLDDPGSFVDAIRVLQDVNAFKEFIEKVKAA